VVITKRLRLERFIIARNEQATMIEVLVYLFGANIPIHTLISLVVKFASWLEWVVGWKTKEPNAARASHD